MVTIPRDIYPTSEGYLGLSTRDATLVGDTIYPFTDLVRTDSFTFWNQVGLHQFKSYDDINKWYNDTTDIHMSNDFTWTDGNYLSQLLGVTPIMDSNRLRIWYWGYDLAKIGPVDTTYHVHLVGSDLHPDWGHWGIGTSEYIFSNTSNTIEKDEVAPNITVKYYQNKGTIKIDNTLPSIINISSISEQLLFQNMFTSTLNFNIDYDGIILINVINDNLVLTNKYFSSY